MSHLPNVPHLSHLPLDLKNKIALMTGGKRIGRVVAEELAKRGVDVAVCYSSSRGEADTTAAAVRGHGRRAAALRADLSDPDACRSLVASAARELGGLDVLIHMASVYDKCPLAELRTSDWNRSLDIELRAAFLCAQAAAPLMRARGGGRIVNFSDWLPASGRPRYPGYLTYYVAKAGVKALTEALALELAPDNILVNALAPGPILAPDATTPAELRAVERETPLGRWGGEMEIAKAVIALLESDFTTGETIRVDGGRHLN